MGGVVSTMLICCITDAEFPLLIDSLNEFNIQDKFDRENKSDIGDDKDINHQDELHEEILTDEEPGSMPEEEKEPIEEVMQAESEEMEKIMKLISQGIHIKCKF